MEQNYVYAEEDVEEGLTFKKVGYFFKKGWLRMIIYAVVLALLATVIAVPIKVFYKSEPVAETTIEFIYDGIEKGKDPNGGTFNTDEIISTTVLADAVKVAGLDSVVKNISTLRDAMRVEGVMSEEYYELVQAAADGNSEAINTLRTRDFFPTRFTIVISDPSELGLSDAQATKLLDNVVKSYYKAFKDRYSVTTMFASDMYNLSSNDMYEFTAIYDTYTVSLASVKSYLADIAAEVPSFVSTLNSTTFTQLLSELNILLNNYDQYNAHILSNNVWRNKAAARNSLLASQTDINNKLEPLKEYINALNEQISKIQPNTTTTDNGGAHSVTVSYPKEYFEFQASLDEANRQVKDYNVQLANIATRLQKLPEGESTATDAALLASAISDIERLETQTAAFVNKVNSTIQDYYDTTFISSSVRQVVQPVVTRRSIDFSLLLVYAVAVLIGILIAGVVTCVKIARANKVRAAVASGNAQPQEQATPTEKETDKK